MKHALWMAAVFCLCACVNSGVQSDKVFTTAQILYQQKDAGSKTKEAALQMPSYFLDLEYSAGQTQLSAAQLQKVDALLKKLDYPDEYKIYASLGAGGSNDQVSNLAPILKRAEDIKKRYSHQVKEVKVAYLKNQKPDSVYIRLLG
jgi:hypothetical protein